MIALIRLALAIVASLFRYKARLEVENTALRHQLIVLRRKLPGRVKLTDGDRSLFVWLDRLFPSVRPAFVLVQPETLIRWHREGFRRYWCWKSRRQSGRPPAHQELRDLIGRMSREKPLWGATRIHGELLKLGFQVAQSTVAKYMARRRGPPSQGWKTFLHNDADGIAMDLSVSKSSSCLYREVHPLAQRTLARDSDSKISVRVRSHADDALSVPQSSSTGSPLTGYSVRLKVFCTRGHMPITRTATSL